MKNIRKMICLAICVVMLCAMPGAPASAVVEENGIYSFTTFEELEQLCADFYPEIIECVYTGETPLEITRDLIVAGEISLISQDAPVVIAEGVTVQMNGSLGVNELIVHGTLKNYGALSILQRMEITGGLENADLIYMYGGVDTQLIGADRITYTYDGSGVIWMCSFDSGAELARIAAAAGEATDPQWVYGVYADAEQVTLESSVMLPANCVFVVSLPLTISGGEDCTLGFSGKVQINEPLRIDCGVKVDEFGYIDIYAPLSIGGMLDNKGLLDVYYDDGGRLSMDSPDGYIDHYAEVSNMIFINSASAVFPRDAMSGIRADWFTIMERDNEYGHYWMVFNYKKQELQGLLGDVSGDGVIDSYDAALVAMYDVYLIDETGLDLSAADVSGDGIVDSYDAALIAMYDVYLIPEFPAAS